MVASREEQASEQTDQVSLPLMTEFLDFEVAPPSHALKNHLLALLQDVVLFGLMNFAFLVPAYHLAASNDMSAFYVCLAFQFLFYWQHNKRIIQMFCMIPGHEQLIRARISEMKAINMCCGHVVYSGLTYIRCMYLAGTIHFFDPTLDAANAGRARHAFGPEQHRNYAFALQSAPGFGQFFMDTDLSSILTTLLICVTCVKFASFVFWACATALAILGTSETDFHKEANFVGLMSFVRETADSSSMSLVAKVADLFVQSSNEAQAGNKVTWSKLIFHEFLEGVPNLHFGVTLFVFTLVEADRFGLLLNILSICSSTFVVGCAAYKAFVSVIRLKDSAWACIAIPVFVVLGMFLALVILESLLRLGMSLICPDHVFSIINCQCIDFQSLNATKHNRSLSAT